jgi:FAD/FMN-containing dehydrogenase
MNDIQMATTGGTDRLIRRFVIEEFGSKLRGGLLCADDEEYDRARRVWNGMVDNHPALIARCRDTDDAAGCVRFAREHGVLLSVRGGGHNYAGKAVCNGGLVADLSLMKGIYVDQANQTARAQPGVRLGEFDRATQVHGLATTLGVNTDTGIAGLTLGGGYGWLAGKYGLACDNLLSAEVVTADGTTMHCSEEQNADLFWGLRGAGANFGIVTEFTYRLHSVGPVLGGVIVYALNADVVRFFDELSHNAPDELTTMGAVLTGPNGLPAFGIFVCSCGALQEGERVLKQLRTFAKPIVDSMAFRPYLEMQSLLDASWPAGRHYYNKAHNIRRISKGAIETVLRYSADLPTPLTNIAFQQLHGAAGRVGAGETAFPHRYDHFDLLVHPATDDPLDSPQMIAWARECWTALKPFVEPAVYVNALEDGEEEGERRVREAYGANYSRLAALKAKYDPENVFRQNSNIKPSGK